MKTFYIKDIQNNLTQNVDLLGWISRIHKIGGMIFINITDSTGTIQITLDKSKKNDLIFRKAMTLQVESSVHIRGKLIKKKNKVEILPNMIEIIGAVNHQYSPNPRSNFSIFDPKYTNLILSNRHIYIRNPKLMYILKIRNYLTHQLRSWFDENMFTEITAPILTPTPLYEDNSAIGVNIHNDHVFLTQCVGYYLEAAVHAFEKVYNIGPSFRGEESRSKRHLMEYWHVKAEVAFVDLEDIIAMVEEIIHNLSLKIKTFDDENNNILGKKICLDGLNIPYPRITYEEAINSLKNKGFNISFGKSLGSKEEAELSKKFKSTPFWITGIPREIEPFPYVISSEDKRVTKTADLIASNGYGELLGVAEKISNLNMLVERMTDKKKYGDPRYDWIIDVHRVGCVPHAAFGMGLERLIRWMIDIPHVRDAIPFPRIFRRKIYP